MNQLETMNYLVEQNKKLMEMVMKMQFEINSLKEEIHYNGLLAKTSSPAISEEDRKDAILEVAKINENKKEKEALPKVLL